MVSLKWFVCAEVSVKILGQIAGLSSGFDLGGSPDRRVFGPKECKLIPAV